MCLPVTILYYWKIFEWKDMFCIMKRLTFPGPSVWFLITLNNLWKQKFVEFQDIKNDER